MRNDNNRWDGPSMDPMVFDSDAIAIQQIWPESQILVSGPNVLNMSLLPLVGWPSEGSETSYAVVLRRDRVLEINGPARVDGWDAGANLAVSDMTAGYSVFQLDGINAGELLKHGGFVDPFKPSRSVSRLLFGLPALLYRRGENRYLIHVTSPFEQAMRGMLLSHLTA